MADRQTLDVYDSQTARYAARAQGEPSESAALQAMIDALPPGARVLDLGCGPGHFSAAMARAGLSPDPVDASAEMVAHAAREYGLLARQATFADLVAEAAYDAVWANFSLLHAPKAEFPGHLARIRRALKAGGLLHLGMKMGEGEARDALGRFYAYYGEEELAELVIAAGFAVTGTKTGTGTGLDEAGFAWCFLTARAT
ncbi:class I SAM-dependent methyltransferase [Pseudooceanicola nanhaiensis]|uniref:class I SAM-dependent methyltransferase n=1 Tax=Pseudooceanicola nanhaiensis TaxID=375761 RepID=UPI001CD29BF3|nr:class I SAM-dependent methyltransferase [Pseudooceanicola nanhaiensis]MCA0918840.1 class I SAM-dependent methyltransferase [Pseudooceanicola nanhaiensis]